MHTYRAYETWLTSGVCVVSPIITARLQVRRIQLQRIRQEENDGRFPRTQERGGPEAGTGLDTKGIERAADDEGTGEPHSIRSARCRGSALDLWVLLRDETNWFLCVQRQTIVSQFYQIDRLVVEGGISVCIPRIWKLDSGDVLDTHAFTGQADGKVGRRCAAEGHGVYPHIPRLQVSNLC